MKAEVYTKLIHFHSEYGIETDGASSSSTSSRQVAKTPKPKRTVPAKRRRESSSSSSNPFWSLKAVESILVKHYKAAYAVFQRQRFYATDLGSIHRMDVKQRGKIMAIMRTTPTCTDDLRSLLLKSSNRVYCCSGDSTKRLNWAGPWGEANSTGICRYWRWSCGIHITSTREGLVPELYQAHNTACDGEIIEYVLNGEDAESEGDEEI